MRKQIDLLNGPIFSSLTRLALPIMATSLVQMAYSLTDMAWVGRVGSTAVAAVGTAGMYSWLSQGILMLPKMGGQIKVAHSLGEGNKKDAVLYAQGALQMGIAAGIIFALLALTFTRQLIGFFGLNDPATINGAVIYTRITCGFIIFSFINGILTGIFTAQGDSKTPFLANVTGLVSNMILDPLLIFGIGFFPRLEEAGAATATVTAQIIVFAVFMSSIRRDRSFFGDIHILGRTPLSYFNVMIRLGFPSSLQNVIYCFISMVLTRFVAVWGDGAVAVQKLGSQIESISWMTADGFSASINSFVGQNYGARRYDRIKSGYFAATLSMFIWGTLCGALLICGAEPIFRIFINEPDVVPIGVSYLVVLGYSQMLMCIESVTVGALSGLGKTFLSSVISITITSARIPIAYILMRTSLGVTGAWWALTLTSVAKGIIFFIVYLNVLKKLPNEEKLTDVQF